MNTGSEEDLPQRASPVANVPEGSGKRRKRVSRPMANFPRAGDGQWTPEHGVALALFSVICQIEGQYSPKSEIQVMESDSPESLLIPEQ